MSPSKLRATDALVLPDDVSAVESAAAFVNPLTALGMIETMRQEGCTALVHTAAASTLGQSVPGLEAELVESAFALIDQELAR